MPLNAGAPMGNAASQTERRFGKNPRTVRLFLSPSSFMCILHHRTAFDLCIVLNSWFGHEALKIMVIDSVVGVLEGVDKTKCDAVRTFTVLTQSETGFSSETSNGGSAVIEGARLDSYTHLQLLHNAFNFFHQL